MQNKYLLKKEFYFSFKSFADSHYSFASTAGGGLLSKPMNQPLIGVAEIPQAHVWNLWSWISLVVVIELVGCEIFGLGFLTSQTTKLLSQINHMLGRWTVSLNIERNTYLQVVVGTPWLMWKCLNLELIPDPNTTQVDARHNVIYCLSRNTPKKEIKCLMFLSARILWISIALGYYR